MNLNQVIQDLDLNVLTKSQDFSLLSPTSGYVSDLLSCVMAGAPHNGIWVTLQAHINIVAVAALLELTAVIITEGAVPDQSTVDKANEENIVLLSTPRTSFEIVGKLWDLGLRSG
jgi:hypothetical protein